jgi:hypothetical protein
VRITILISALLCSACAEEPKSPGADPWLRELRDTGIGPFDVDGDGHSSSEDCDDTDPLIYPGAEEVCDGLDNDCDGEADEGLLSTFFVDSDGDGFGTDSSETAACEVPSGTVSAGGDCDDADAAVHPGADEFCDGLDSDCDGQVDGPEPVDPQRFYADSDGDGFGDSLAVVLTCDQPAGTSVNDLDCDDSSFAIFPGASEYCDGIDNNCDGVIDDLSAIDAGTWSRDADGDGFGNPDITGLGCTAPTGFVEDGSDCDDTDLHVHPAADEVCNGADDDCDGTIDEGFSLTPWYRDADGDGHGDFTHLVYSCTPIAGYSASSDDCDDAEYWSHPGLAELCDEIDNDCDGVVDEELSFVDFVPDADGDGYGSAAGPVVSDCIPPADHVVDTSDCDDADASVHPGAVEACNGVDDNCDGTLDEDLPLYSYYLDEDGDEFGLAEVSVEACDTPEGYAALDTDCDDGDDHIHPGGYELCNEIDDDCNGLVDDDCGDRREFVLYVTNATIGSSESSWLDSRDDADAFCQDYADSHGIAVSDATIVYSTPDEDAKDHLLYIEGDLIWDSEGALVDEEDLWGGSDIRLPDMASYTITSSWNDGEFHECSGSYPSGSWPICQYCDQKFACGSSSDNPFEPSACCWTGTRAVVCLGAI